MGFVSYDTLWEETLGVSFNGKPINETSDHELADIQLNEASDPELLAAYKEFARVRKYARFRNSKIDKENYDIRLIHACLSKRAKNETLNVNVSYDWYEDGKEINLGQETLKTIDDGIRIIEKDLSGSTYHVTSQVGDKTNYQKMIDDDNIYHSKYGAEHSARAAIDSLKSIKGYIQKWMTRYRYSK